MSNDDSTKLKINGKPVAATHFVYDGCHKIYLISTPADRENLLAHKWLESDLRPIVELPAAWKTTCSLRFIGSGDLQTEYVAQGDDFADVTCTWEVDQLFVAVIELDYEIIAIGATPETAVAAASVDAWKFLRKAEALTPKTDTPDKIVEHFGFRVITLGIGAAGILGVDR